MPWVRSLLLILGLSKTLAQSCPYALEHDGKLPDGCDVKEAGSTEIEESNPACCGCWGYRTDVDGKGYSDKADSNFSGKAFDPATHNPEDAENNKELTDAIEDDNKDSNADSTEIFRSKVELCPPGESDFADGAGCRHRRDDHWTVQENREYKDSHIHDWRDCHAYGRSAGQAQCIWEFFPNEHGNPGDYAHQFECMTVNAWREHNIAHSEMTAWYFVVIAVIACICAFPACFRMPCYKKYCTSDYDICCKGEKEKIKRRSTIVTMDQQQLQLATGPKEMTPDRRQSPKGKSPKARSGGYANEAEDQEDPPSKGKEQVTTTSLDDKDKEPTATESLV